MRRATLSRRAQPAHRIRQLLVWSFTSIAALTFTEATWAQAKNNKSGATPAPTPSVKGQSVKGSVPKPENTKPALLTKSSVNAPEIVIPFEKYVLANGLEVILHRDTSLPSVAVSVWYHVGPVNEPPKRSGFAHLFEHLMFGGSRDVGTQMDQLLESVGATNMNGTTNWDRTNYFETVPSEHLELALWIESDRMGFLLDGIGQKQLDIQRDVVKNERRQSFENAPYGPSSLALLDTLFPEGHPYHGAVIGSMQDLTAATFEDVKAFYRDYYAPSNATLALAGDFDINQAKVWIEKYFATLRKLPKPQTRPFEPKPVAAARLEVDEPVQVSKIALGWVTPAAYTPSSAALELAAEVLAGGKATRLYRALVVEQKLAVDVDADTDANALGTIFSIDASAASGVAPERIESAINAELERLGQTPPSDAEMHRAKSRILLSVMRDLQSLNGHGGESGRVGQLQRFNHYLGNPGKIRDWYEQLWKVTSTEVSTATKQWLSTAHRVTVVTRPSKKGQGS